MEFRAALSGWAERERRQTQQERDTWTSMTVPFHVPAGWSAWVLYNFTSSGVDEVAFHYAVTMPL